MSAYQPKRPKDQGDGKADLETAHIVTQTPWRRSGCRPARSGQRTTGEKGFHEIPRRAATVESSRNGCSPRQAASSVPLQRRIPLCTFERHRAALSTF
jgi:hypothetical protein